MYLATKRNSQKRSNEQTLLFFKNNLHLHRMLVLFCIYCWTHGYDVDPVGVFQYSFFSLKMYYSYLLVVERLSETSQDERDGHGCFYQPERNKEGEFFMSTTPTHKLTLKAGSNNRNELNRIRMCYVLLTVICTKRKHQRRINSDNSDFFSVSALHAPTPVKCLVKRNPIVDFLCCSF